MMFGALRRQDDPNRSTATEILRRLGPEVVPQLVAEASAPKLQPDHRVRLLDVLQQIRSPLSAGDYYLIQRLGEHPVERVARKAREVLRALHPDGPPSLLPPEVAEALAKVDPFAAIERGARLFRRRLTQKATKARAATPRRRRWEDE
jgi:hypothetical protein